MRRLLGIARLLLISSMGLAMSACSDADEPHPRGPGHGTPARAAEVARHAPDVVLSIHSTGGEGAPGHWAPDVEVRADGTVFLRAESGLGVEMAALTPAGLDRVRARFATVSMSEDDYDESEWTDMPSTSVYASWGGQPERISVYGFRVDDEVGDDDWERLGAAIGFVEDLAGAAVGEDVAAARTTYRPAVVAVVLHPADDAYESWPLTTPPHRDRRRWTTYGQPCVLVTGRDVVTLEALVTERGAGNLTWTTGAPTSSGIPRSADAEVLPVLRDTPAPCGDQTPSSGP